MFGRIGVFTIRVLARIARSGRSSRSSPRRVFRPTVLGDGQSPNQSFVHGEQV